MRIIYGPVALLPHSSSDRGLILTSSTVCVKFARSPCDSVSPVSSHIAV